jgi:hypothetical protein
METRTYQSAGLVLARRADLRMLDRQATILGHKQVAAVLKHQERPIQTSGLIIFKISERLYIKGTNIDNKLVTAFKLKQAPGSGGCSRDKEARMVRVDGLENG